MSAATGNYGYTITVPLMVKPSLALPRRISLTGRWRDKLTGGSAGDDALTGGTGNDTFSISSSGDVTIADLQTNDVLIVASTTGSLTATVPAAGFTAAAADKNSKSLADVKIFQEAAGTVDMALATTSFGFTIEGDNAAPTEDEDNVLKVLLKRHHPRSWWY